MPDIKQKAEEFYKDMLNQLTNTEEGKKALAEAEDKIKKTLMDWAEAKAHMLFGTDEQKEVYKVVMEYSQDAITDIKDALSAQVQNYLLERFISELKSILITLLLKV